MAPAGRRPSTGSRRDPPQPGSADPPQQGAVNAEIWSHGDFVSEYAKRELRPPEAALFDRFGAELAGRVLELGCGAGRVTGHLIGRARSVEALDLSPAMIAYCRASYPGASFSVGDLGDLSRFRSRSFEAVVASFCVLDVLDDPARRRALGEIRRVLEPGGMLIASSHNLHYAPRIAKPPYIRSRSPVRVLQNLVRLRLRMRNYRRLRALERFETDYAILVDEAHDFSLLHYYVSRDAQARQLTAQGFELLECLALDGSPVGPGEAAAGCPELYYAARRLD